MSTPQPLPLREVAQIRVIYGDTVQMGLVYYANYLRYFEVGRNEYLRAAGALDATAFGAYDYLLKPFGVEELQSLSAALRDQLNSRPHRVSIGKRAAAHRSRDCGADRGRTVRRPAARRHRR